MELNFKSINNLLAVLDALVNETCEGYATDYFNYDRKEIEGMTFGKWGYFTIRTNGSDFTNSIRKHNQYVNDFNDVRFTALIICEDKESFSLSLYKR